jgi:hypothetical protein
MQISAGLFKLWQNSGGAQDGKNVAVQCVHACASILWRRLPEISLGSAQD